MSKHILKNLILIICILSLSLVFNGINNINSVNAKTNADDWHFIVIGDTRQPLGYWDSEINHYTHDNQTNPIRAAIVENIVNENPNVSFIVHTGDVVASGVEQDDWNRYFEDIKPITDNNLTIYYAVGNHEYYSYAIGSGSWGPEDPDLITYKANVDLPGNEKWYSFDIDGIHFQFINTDEEGEEKTVQANWLSNDFANNVNEFIISIFHRPMYSIRDSGRVEDAQEIRTEFDTLFQQNGVDLVLSGHDHYYYRTQRNNAYYLTVAGGGAELKEAYDLSEWQEGDVFHSEYHYCNITVSTLSLKVDMLIFNTETNTTLLGDSFEISRLTVPEFSQFSLNFLLIFSPILIVYLMRTNKKKK